MLSDDGPRQGGLAVVDLNSLICGPEGGSLRRRKTEPGFDLVVLTATPGARQIDENRKRYFREIWPTSDASA